VQDRGVVAPAEAAADVGIGAGRVLFAQPHGDLARTGHGAWYQEMQTLGLNYRMPEMAAAPSDEQREHFKLRKLLWNVAPKKHNELFGEHGTTKSPPPSNEQLFQAIVAAGVDLQHIHDAEAVSPGPGHRAFKMQDGQKFVDGGVLGLFHNWYSSDPADLAEKLASGGNVSTAQRWKTGMGGKGQSSDDDMASGGAEYVFHHRLAENSAFHGLHSALGLHIVTGPETLERSDWHASDDDNFGDTKGGHQQSYYKRAGRYEVLKKYGEISEYMVEHSVGLDEIRAIVCAKGETVRQKLIAELKSRGIHQIGGKPVEQVVVTSIHQARAQVKTAWAETQAARADGRTS